MRYASTHIGIVTIMGLYLVHALAVGPIIQLLAAYSDVAFGRGPEGLAILTSASGLGSILGGMWMTRPSSISDLTKVVCTAGFLAVFIVVVFVSLTNLTVAMVVICFYSSMTVAFRVASQTLVQLSVTDAMRGRVMGLWAMLNRGGPSIGAILMGVVTNAYGRESRSTSLLAHDHHHAGDHHPSTEPLQRPGGRARAPERLGYDARQSAPLHQAPQVIKLIISL
jgi:predicted MFS family arabinose efflux permease